MLERRFSWIIQLKDLTAKNNIMDIEYLNEDFRNLAPVARSLANSNKDDSKN